MTAFVLQGHIYVYQRNSVQNCVGYGEKVKYIFDKYR